MWTNVPFFISKNRLCRHKGTSDAENYKILNVYEE